MSSVSRSSEVVTFCKLVYTSALDFSEGDGLRTMIFGKIYWFLEKKAWDLVDRNLKKQLVQYPIQLKTWQSACWKTIKDNTPQDVLVIVTLNKDKLNFKISRMSSDGKWTQEILVSTSEWYLKCKLLYNVFSMSILAKLCEKQNIELDPFYSDILC